MCFLFQGNYDAYIQTRSELEENQMKKYRWEQDQISHMKVSHWPQATGVGVCVLFSWPRGTHSMGGARLCVYNLPVCVQPASVCTTCQCVYNLPVCVQPASVCTSCQCVYNLPVCVQPASVCITYQSVYNLPVCVQPASLCTTCQSVYNLPVCANAHTVDNEHTTCCVVE